MVSISDENCYMVFATDNPVGWSVTCLCHAKMMKTIGDTQEGSVTWRTRNTGTSGSGSGGTEAGVARWPSG